MEYFRKVMAYTYDDIRKGAQKYNKDDENLLKKYFAAQDKDQELVKKAIEKHRDIEKGLKD